MTKLRWENKTETYEIAWVPGLDMSCLSVDSAPATGQGVRWAVNQDHGYAPTMDEAKAACEAKIAQRLQEALAILGQG
jgi:hypothetical protein